MEINNNIEESYCSLEVSKLLKEKECEVDTLNVYRSEIFETYGEYELGYYSNSENKKGIVAAPTHALAIEWIRINFGFWIEIYKNASGYGYIIQKTDTGSIIKEITDFIFFNSPQEATELALLYTLQNLIK